MVSILSESAPGLHMLSVGTDPQYKLFNMPSDSAINGPGCNKFKNDVV